MAQSKNSLKNVQKKDKKTMDEVVHPSEIQDVLPVEELKVEELTRVTEEVLEIVTPTEVVDDALPPVVESDPQPEVDVILEPSPCSLETLEVLDPILPCGEAPDVSNDKTEFALDLHPGYFEPSSPDVDGDVLASNPCVVDTRSFGVSEGCEDQDDDCLTNKFNRLVTVLLQELGAGMRGGPEGLAKSLRKAKLI